MHAELDPEQMTAFEIRTATYVLTFYDEAIRDTSGADQSCSEKAKDGLCQLARRNLYSDAPLIMFVTGLAGAGKCKFIGTDRTVVEPRYAQLTNCVVYCWNHPALVLLLVTISQGLQFAFPQ
jgi:hypothetical protein